MGAFQILLHFHLRILPRLPLSASLVQIGLGTISAVTEALRMILYINDVATRFPISPFRAMSSCYLWVPPSLVSIPGVLIIPVPCLPIFIAQKLHCLLYTSFIDSHR